MFTFSKKNLIIGLMLLSALYCVHGSENDSAGKDRVRFQSPTKGGRFLQIIGWKKSNAGGQKKRFGWSILAIVALIVGLLALFCPTGVEAHGKNIFADQGASMYLRGIVAFSCLTLSIGAGIVAGWRAYKCKDMTTKEYDAWKNGQNKKWYQKNSSRNLQAGFFISLLILAVIIIACGWSGNSDNAMFHFAWALPMIGGAFGIGFVLFRYGSHTQKIKLDDIVENWQSQVEEKDASIRKIKEEHQETVKEWRSNTEQKDEKIREMEEELTKEREATHKYMKAQWANRLHPELINNPANSKVNDKNSLDSDF